jgi:hypothetical protein
MAAARPLHLIRGGASLHVRAFPPISRRHQARASPQNLLCPHQRHGPSSLTAPEGRVVDQAVDIAVDSHLSRGITRAFLWISLIRRKILKFLPANSCASSANQSKNSFTAKAEVLPGGNSRNAGETRATGTRATGISVAASHARRLAASARKPGNRRPSTAAR